MSLALSFVIAAAAVVAITWVFDAYLRHRFNHPSGEGKLYPESLYRTSVTEDGVSCIDPKGSKTFVAWAELASVAIHTNDTGPGGCDLVWALYDRTGKLACAIPNGATGENELLPGFQRLPGFSNEHVTRAMCCTDNAVFICWSNAPSGSPAGDAGEPEGGLSGPA